MSEEEKKETLNDEEKMKKKFGKLRKIMTVIEGFLMVVPIMVIVVLVIIGISVGFDKTKTPSKVEYGENKSIILYDEDVGDIDWRTEILDILDMKEELENDDDYKNATDTLKNLMVVSTILAALIGYVLAIIIVDNLAKIFGEVEKEGTPFTERNIKLLKRINIISIFLWIIGMMGFRKNSIGLIFIIVISAFRSVFEYGYKLQRESDETL